MAVLFWWSTLTGTRFTRVSERVDRTTAELADPVAAGTYAAVLLDMNFALGDHRSTAPKGRSKNP